MQETTSEELISSLIEEIEEETSMSYDDAKDLLSLLFDKMRECDNDTVTEAICTDL
jgi:nucleoid DNA-binding protein